MTKETMKNKIWLFVPIFGLCIFSGCSQDTLVLPQELAATNSTYKDGNTVGVSADGHSWCAEIVQSDTAKNQGLSGRESLSAGSAMLFPFPEASRYQFWMKDMKFDIDMVWIEDAEIVDITRNVAHPEKQVDEATLPRYTPKTPVNFVLEVAKGEASSLAIGDAVTYTKQCAKTPSL